MSDVYNGERVRPAADWEAMMDICTAQTIWEVPTATLARFFELLAEATEQGDPEDFWDHFSARQLARIFGSIAARQAGPPQTVDQATNALLAMLQAHRARLQ